MKNKKNPIVFSFSFTCAKNKIATIVFHKIQQSRQQIFLITTPYFLKLRPFLYRYFSSHQKRRDVFYFTIENRKDMYLGFSFNVWIYIRFITQYLYVLTVNAEKLFVLVEQTVVVAGITRLYTVKPEKICLLNYHNQKYKQT